MNTPNHEDTKAPSEPAHQLGLLVDFNSALMKQGMQRIAL